MLSTTTLVGVFDDLADALRARERLHAAGVGAGAIRIEHGHAEAIDDAPSLLLQPVRRRGFFAELFGLGDDDETPSHYAEAVRRGGIVLAVDVAEDERVDAISAVLQDAGAIDINERAQAWRAAGYDGDDERAPRPSDEEAAGERARAVPVSPEGLQDGKREVGKGIVRVHRRMITTPVEEQVALRDERVVVERTPVDERSEAGARREQTAAADDAELPAAPADVMSRNYVGPDRRQGGSRPYAGQERRVAQPA